jgi:membrane protease YdiL (CAAX protease family)
LTTPDATNPDPLEPEEPAPQPDASYISEDPAPAANKTSVRSSAPAEMVRCPSCRKKFADDKKFCPFCGRSRKELEAAAEQNKIIATSARETLSAWQQLHMMATFYVILLALNFISVYMLPTGKPWGLLMADLGIVIVCACWAANAGKYVRNRFRAGFAPAVLLVLPLSAIATYVITVLNNNLFILVLGLRDAEEHVRGTESFRSVQFPMVILVLSICVMPGIFEEIFFRGLVQGTLEEMMAKREALFVQAVIFAIAHLNPIGFFTYLVFLGLYLGWLRNKSGSLIPGMLVHFTHNLIVVLNERYHIVNF